MTERWTLILTAIPATVQRRAALGGPDGKITVSGTINIDTLTFSPTVGSYSLDGGTINFAIGPDRS